MLPNPIADVDSEIGDNSIDLNSFVKFVPRKKTKLQAPIFK
jgi:hypothetical protein